MQKYLDCNNTLTCVCVYFLRMYVYLYQDMPNNRFETLNGKLFSARRAQKSSIVQFGVSL